MLLKMKVFLLLFVLPCLVFADIQCPESEITCPESQRCCIVDGQTTCCDLEEDIPQGKRKVFAGKDPEVPSYTFQNMTEIRQEAFGCPNCYGTCCFGSACCPYTNAQCCSFSRCCMAGTTCCNGGAICCFGGGKCCGAGCCASGAQCCGGNCCSSLYRCCGDWCCKNSQKCGLKKYTCIGAAAIFSPTLTTLFLLVGFAITSKSYFS